MCDAEVLQAGAGIVLDSSGCLAANATLRQQRWTGRKPVTLDLLSLQYLLCDIQP